MQFWLYIRLDIPISKREFGTSPPNHCASNCICAMNIGYSSRTWLEAICKEPCPYIPDTTCPCSPRCEQLMEQVQSSLLGLQGTLPAMSYIVYTSRDQYQKKSTLIVEIVLIAKKHEQRWRNRDFFEGWKFRLQSQLFYRNSNDRNFE